VEVQLTYYAATFSRTHQAHQEKKSSQQRKRLVTTVWTRGDSV
jgi:hypothetical protein